MKNKFVSLLIISFVLFSQNLYAGVTCDAEKITQILIYDSKIVVRQGNIYRGLGFSSSAKNQDRKLSVIMAAKATGDLVQLTYPEGYNCSEDNYGEDPELVVVK